MADIISLREKINEIDKAMAKLFCERMDAVKEIADFKAINSLPILNLDRENEVITKNSELVSDPTIKAHYINFIKGNISISRSYQAELHPDASSGILYEKEHVKKIPVSLGEDSYDIF